MTNFFGFTDKILILRLFTSVSIKISSNRPSTNPPAEKSAIQKSFKISLIPAMTPLRLNSLKSLREPTGKMDESGPDSLRSRLAVPKLDRISCLTGSVMVFKW
jgi:hypothetical protein